MFRALGVCGMEWGMVGVAAMEEKKWCRNGRGFARQGEVFVLCVVL